MYNVCGLGTRSSDQKVVGFDISVDQITFVNSLDARKLVKLAFTKETTMNIWQYHLLGNHNNRLDGESTMAVIE
jgi:hypothetical protein